MKFKFIFKSPTTTTSHLSTKHLLIVSFSTLTETLNSVANTIDNLCSETPSPPPPPPPEQPLFLNPVMTREDRVKKAWSYWLKIGDPKFIVAPMVDNSELPFRILCRKYGAEAAYTPMLHSRIFSENHKYRSQEFTTCKEDRPLFVQFWSNDLETLEAARPGGGLLRLC